MMPYQEGKEARLAGKALLSNPYVKGYEFAEWNSWRQGWMDEDHALHFGE